MQENKKSNLESSYERSQIEAAYALISDFEDGKKTEKDLVALKERVPYLNQAAEQGDILAQYALGVCFEIKKNYAKAFDCYNKTAKKGHASGQRRVGKCYQNGWAVEKNLILAIEWYQKAIAQGNTAAQINLGLCYESGQGVKKDLGEAMLWYQKAAQQGNANGQFNLGVCYEEGQRVEKNFNQAVHWYQKAAQQGHAIAQYNLGMCYREGNGVEKNLSQAMHWYEKAAKQGIVNAQFLLGHYYQYGEGVAKDLEQAAFWHQKAADQGNANSKSALMLLKLLKKEPPYQQLTQLLPTVCVTKPVKTEDDGNCAFHAVLGHWDPMLQRVICLEADTHRQTLHAAVISTIGCSNNPLFPLICEGIQAFIMSGRSLPKAMVDIQKQYQQFFSTQNQIAPQLWQDFEKVLQGFPDILVYVANHHQLKSDATLHAQFHNALNQNEDELSGLICSLPDLQTAFETYNQRSTTTFPWDTLITGEMIKAYAEFIGKSGQWLLASEIALIAQVFEITVLYYPSPGAKVQILNPNQPKTVSIQFNGVNHFEQILEVERQQVQSEKNLEQSGQDPLCEWLEAILSQLKSSETYENPVVRQKVIKTTSLFVEQTKSKIESLNKEVQQKFSELRKLLLSIQLESQEPMTARNVATEPNIVRTEPLKIKQPSPPIVFSGPRLIGKKGTYRLIPIINLEIAKQLQQQTGLTVSFMPGKSTTKFIKENGTFGQLHLGINPENSQYFGIKEIPVSDPEEKEKIKEEAAIQGSLTGLPHLMPLEDSIEEKDHRGNLRIYQIMPLSALGNGEDLGQYLASIRDDAFKNSVLIHIAKGLLTGLAAMHSKNIAHHDFKPANFVVGQNGLVRIIDFGCARPLNEMGQASYDVKGDSDYFSPERNLARKQETSFDGKADDTWGLGLSLLTLAIYRIDGVLEGIQEPQTHPFLQAAQPGSYTYLIKQLLHPSPAERLTTEEALQSPLFQSETSKQILDYLQEFVQTLQWQKSLENKATPYRLRLVAEGSPINPKWIKERTIILQMQGDQLIAHYWGADKNPTQSVIPVPSVGAYYLDMLTFPEAGDKKLVEFDEKHYKLIIDRMLILCGLPKPPLLTSSQQLPPPHFSGYVHRTALERALLDELTVGDLAAGKIIACCGIGGIGKSQLLNFLVHTPDLTSHYKIFWIRAADDESSLRTQYYGLAKELGLITEEDEQKHIPSGRVRDILIRWFEREEQPWLLVFDNADQPKLLKPYLPQKGGTILVSSRSSEWPKAISLNIMSLEEVHALLQKWLPERQNTLEEAKILGEAMEYLPLALVQAIALIRQNQLAIPAFLENYQQKQGQEEVLHANNPLIGQPLPHSLVTLYAMQMKKLKDECPQALLLLEYSSFFAPDDLPFELLDKIFDLHQGRNFINIVKVLDHYALWQLNFTEDTVQIRMHRLIQEVVRLPFSGEKLKTHWDMVAKTEMAAGYSYRQNSEQQGVHHQSALAVLKEEERHKRLQPHLQYLITIADKESVLQENNVTLSSVLSYLGDIISETGDIENAINVLERALRVGKDSCPEGHRMIAIIIQTLGVCYAKSGNHQAAESYLNDALSMQEIFYGKEHPNVAIVLSHLGSTYSISKNLMQAKNLFERSLTIKETHYGSHHAEVAAVLTNLSMTCIGLKNFQQAKVFLDRALKIYETHYKGDHRNIANTLLSLANYCGEMYDYKQKIILLERALSILQRHCGKDHPALIQFLYQLGSGYFQTNDYKVAISCCSQGCEILGRSTLSNALILKLGNQLNTVLEKSKKKLAEQQAGSQALKELKNEDAYEQNRLGVCYRDGKKVQKNIIQAMFCFLKAAQLGHLEAQYNLGVIFSLPDYRCDELGEKQDMIKSAYWLQKAAEQGHSEAQFLLGNFYSAGIGVGGTDIQKAFFWYKKAAEKGHILAAIQVSCLSPMVKIIEAAGNENKKTKSSVESINQAMGSILAILSKSTARLEPDKSVGQELSVATPIIEAASNPPSVLLTHSLFAPPNPMRSKRPSISSPKTKADGDCAFHAVLGHWDGKEFVCQDATKYRLEMQQAILGSSNDPVLYQLVMLGIREWIMSGRATIGQKSLLLKQRYQRFLEDQYAASPALWAVFEAVLKENPEIVEYITQHHQLKNTQNTSFRAQFYDALHRNEGELYGRILSLPALHTAFQEYNQLCNTAFDWDSACTLLVIKEYANFLGKPGQWLLASELAMIAHVFKIQVNYTPHLGAETEIFNPGQRVKISVQFNGINHFERLSQPAKNTEESHPVDLKSAGVSTMHG